jgi:hypothetical protein
MVAYLNNRRFSMKANAFYLYMVLVFGLFGCTTTIPLSQSFYNSKRIGVVIEVNKIGVAKEGSQGLLDMALTPGDRFQEPLKQVEKQMNIKAQLQKDIASILTVCKKPFQIITDTIYLDDKPTYEGPDIKKKYAKDDWRSVKEQFKIDEVMLVKLDYGLLVSYYGFIETGKQTFATIQTEIVDLSDNSLIEKGRIGKKAPIVGNWSEGKNYSNMKQSLDEAYGKLLNALRLKF